VEAAGEPRGPDGAAEAGGGSRDLHPSGEPAGTASVLSQSFRVGKRHRGLYLRLVMDIGRGWLTAYPKGRVLKRWPSKLLND
jgi:hypothetical protein